MMKRCILALTTATLVFASSLAHSQAMPAASRPGLLQVGFTYSNANTDELTQRIFGATLFATFDVNEHIGVEADISFPSAINSPQDFSEDMYVIGPRYVYRLKDRYEPYFKLQAGIGKTIADEPYVANEVPGTPGSYFAYDFGGGLDVKLPYKLTFRVLDFTYYSFPGFKPNGLTPSVISFGMSYRIR